MIKKLGSSGNPWYIKATIKTSTQATQIVLQDRIKVVNGVAVFETLGLSDITKSFTVEYSFDTPTALSA